MFKTLITDPKAGDIEKELTRVDTVLSMTNTDPQKRIACMYRLAAMFRLSDSSYIGVLLSYFAQRCKGLSMQAR
jgi:hypothetical protein